MDVAAVPHANTSSPAPPWPLRWLTPDVCRVLLILLLAFGFVSHLHYLHNNCPIDLAGDEAQYWDWSRNLDLSYYSKGPLVAYIIAGSTAIFGDTMPAVRYPALVLGLMTSIVSYLLTRRLFGSDQLALGVVALYHLVPMFVAGSTLMTIDPPFYFCWTLATYLLACLMFQSSAIAPAPAAGTPAPEQPRWLLWIAIGIVVGIGFLAKYAMFLWFIPMLLALAVDASSRRWLRTGGPWVAIAVACLFTTPVLIWNARHGWVSAQHVGTQTGAAEGKFVLANVFELIGGQIGVLNPGIALFMVAGVVCALRRRQESACNPASDRAGDKYQKVRFLAVFGVTFFAFTFFTAFRAKVQMNWPAPAYFTLMILAAWFIATRLASRRTWRPWRWWFWSTVVFGLVMLPVAHHTELLYPPVRWINDNLISMKEPWRQQGGWRKAVAHLLPSKPIPVQRFDFAYKLKGWREAAPVISRELRDLGPGAFALCHDYQLAAAFAFYLDNQPKTYTASSYYQHDPGRLTQYDMWPDRDLSPDSPLVGKNAVFIGRHDAVFADLQNAFERVEGRTVLRIKQVNGQWQEVPVQRALTIDIVREGMEVRTFRYFRCYGFKGMTRLVQEKIPR